MIRGNHMRKTWIAVVLTALLATACGSDDSSSATSGAGTGNDSATTVSSEGTGGGSATTESQTDPAGVLRYGAPFKLSKTFDPHKASLGQDNEWLFPAYDRLVHQTKDGQATPGLATAWSFNDDGTVLTLTIRDGVTFHDGTALDAEAVKSNLDRARSLTDSGVKADLASIAEVKVVDPKTVELVLTSPDAGLPLKLSDRGGAMISPAAFAGDDSALATTEAGAGMYRLTEYVPGDRAVYEPYPDYWDKDAVKLSRLEIIAMVDPATRFNSLKGGQIDATYLAPADADAADSAGFTVTPAASLEIYYLGLNSTRMPELGNVKVRQAMMRAIDRDGLVTSLLFGLGEPSVQMFPPGYWAYDPNTTTDDWGYDLDAAKQLMADSGVGDFAFEVIAPGPEPVPTLEAIADQLSKIGITVNIRQVEPAQAAQIYTFDHASDGIIGPWSGRPDPSQTVGQLYTAESTLNVNGGSTPEIEALAAKGLTTLDQDAREQVYQETSAAMTESALYIPIYVRHRPLTASEHVVGLDPYLSGKIEFRGVGIEQ